MSRAVAGLWAWRRGADDFQAGLFGFHVQVADDHLVNAGFDAGKGLGGTAGGFDFKSVEIENGFERQQDGGIIVDKNATFHLHLLRGLEMQCTAESARGGLHVAIAIWRSRELQPRHPLI